MGRMFFERVVEGYLGNLGNLGIFLKLLKFSKLLKLSNNQPCHSLPFNAIGFSPVPPKEKPPKVYQNF
jgi:hypothetical protein